MVYFLFGLLTPVFGQMSKDTSYSKLLRTKLDNLPLDLNLSIELKNGLRTTSAPLINTPKHTLGEVRFQFDGLYYGKWSELKGKLDIGYNAVTKKTIHELRELNIDIYPQLWWSIKTGRQILTWGKGDLLFINDLFPKDFQSFFTGRDIQYLKAPSDAIKLSINPSWFQINLIYTPQFDSDRFPTGEQIVFFDQAFQTFRTNDNNLPFVIPNHFFKDDELAWRFQKTIKGVDIALYGYYGFWKSPSEVRPTDKAYSFSSLHVHGLSIEGSLLGGILGAELGYYASKSDHDGSNPLIRNSEYRYLINYSKDLKNNFTIGLQYYSEVMDHFDSFVLNNIAPNLLPKVQNMLTLRLRKLSMKQRLELSLFTFYGIANEDLYIRPRIAYKLNDYWKIDIGANLFSGINENTFWNQFKWNNNIYLGLKWVI